MKRTLVVLCLLSSAVYAKENDEGGGPDEISTGEGEEIMVTACGPGSVEVNGDCEAILWHGPPPELKPPPDDDHGENPLPTPKCQQSLLGRSDVWPGMNELLADKSKQRCKCEDDCKAETDKKTKKAASSLDTCSGIIFAQARTQCLNGISAHPRLGSPKNRVMCDYKPPIPDENAELYCRIGADMNCINAYLYDTSITWNESGSTTVSATSTLSGKAVIVTASGEITQGGTEGNDSGGSASVGNWLDPCNQAFLAAIPKIAAEDTACMGKCEKK